MYSGMVIWNRHLLELFYIFFVNLLIQMISQDSEELQAKWVIHYEVLQIFVSGHFLYDFVENSPGLVIENFSPKHSSNGRLTLRGSQADHGGGHYAVALVFCNIN